MLHQMAWDSSSDGVGASMDGPTPFEPAQLKPSTPNLSDHDLSCHCCYEILVDPTTLTCGHNICRHCLALWRESSHKNECPECREKWEGFPKVNIVLRYAFHSWTISGDECLIFWQQYSHFSPVQQRKKPTVLSYVTQIYLHNTMDEYHFKMISVLMIIECHGFKTG